MDSAIKHIATVFPISADALKLDSTFRRRRSIVHEFSVNASVHGIPGIGRSTSILNRIFWIVSFVAFTGIMIFFVVQSMQSYFSYPTQTLVSFVAQRVQPFPAVTICNYSPVRFDNFIGPFINFTNSLNLTDTNDTSTITLYQAQYIRNFFRYVLDNNLLTVQYLFSLESMLLYCTYNGQTCTANDFISFTSATYGMCYTFNAKLKSNSSSVRNVTDNGGTGLLQLRLYAQSQLYVPYISEDVSVGMVAMIHDNTELPMVETGGIQLSPGKRHKLSYQKSTYQLLPSPYSDCTTDVPLVMQAMFNQYQGADYAYSTVICNMLCVATYVYEQCNCVNPLQWTARDIVLPGTNQIITAPLCYSTDSCYGNATLEILNSDSIWNQYCSGCVESCSTTDFTVTPSAVSAPSAIEVPVVKAFVEGSNVTLPQDWSYNWLSEIQNNYIALDVVCESSLVESYTQSALIGAVDLLSNIGGLTGLWIGASFLSMMELVEMFYRLVRYHYYKYKNRDVIDIKL